MKKDRSCRDCQRRGTESCYEIRPSSPCDRFLPALSESDRMIWITAKEAADERRYPTERRE